MGVDVVALTLSRPFVTILRAAARRVRTPLFRVNKQTRAFRNRKCVLFRVPSANLNPRCVTSIDFNFLLLWGSGITRCIFGTLTGGVLLLLTFIVLSGDCLGHALVESFTLVAALDADLLASSIHKANIDGRVYAVLLHIYYVSILVVGSSEHHR